jgi:hypothetical protein
MLNSDRFLAAFSAIERHLRELTGRGKDAGFSAAVGAASKSDAAVRRFESDLREFADLRNAIVHERTDGHVLAEPNDRTVEEIERIISLLLDPPKVYKEFHGKVCSLSVGEPVGSAVRSMFEGSFSQIPIYDDGNGFQGLLTANTVARWLGANVKDDLFSLDETSVADVFGFTEDKDNFSFLSRDSTLFEALERFQTYESNGKRLEAILITQTGKPSEALLGITTVWDLPRIHAIVDSP